MEIRLENICKSYENNVVLSNINLTIRSNEITCIMGHSGRGKTTLVNVIAGLVKPDAGAIIWLDKKAAMSFSEGSVAGKHPIDYNAKISIVFQEDRLLNWETALSNVLFVTNKKTTSLSERAQELLIQAGLGDSINKKAVELSGGTKRRVCICRALIAEYDLLILDEPFKGLDSDIKPIIMNMVKEQKNSNKCIICITHDPSEAEYLGGKLIML